MVLFSVAENNIVEVLLVALLLITVVLVFVIIDIPLLVPVTVLLEIMLNCATLVTMALLNSPVVLIVLLLILLLLVPWSNRIPSELSGRVLPLMMLQFRTVMLFFPVALTAFPVSRLL